jgi:hypothetical protein
MDFLRSWTFVNLIAAVSGAFVFAVLEVPAKLKFEPDMLGIFGVPLLAAASVWLAAAVLRHCLLSSRR